MNNQEILLVILVIVLVIIYFFKFNSEPFESNTQNMYCQDYPMNSNCNCAPDTPVKIIDNTVPVSYGTESPYSYKCVSSSYKEPSINLWSTPSN